MTRPTLENLEMLFDLSVDILTVADQERVLAFNPAFESSPADSRVRP